MDLSYSYVGDCLEVYETHLNNQMTLREAGSPLFSNYGFVLLLCGRLFKGL
jgi:hypothetical protein